MDVRIHMRQREVEGEFNGDVQIHIETKTIILRWADIQIRIETKTMILRWADVRICVRQREVNRELETFGFA